MIPLRYHKTTVSQLERPQLKQPREVGLRRSLGKVFVETEQPFKSSREGVIDRRKYHLRTNQMTANHTTIQSRRVIQLPRRGTFVHVKA